MAETDTESNGGRDGGSVFSDRARFGVAIAAIGIVTSGLALNFLTHLGAPGAGTLAFVAGFVLTVGMLWYVLLRPLDFTEE